MYKKVETGAQKGLQPPVFLGGDPSAGSPTDTLLRLNPPCRRQARIRHKPQPHPPPTKMV